MLEADKANLQTELRVEILDLQWKELEYLRTNLQSLAVSSAVVLGFAYQAITSSEGLNVATAIRVRNGMDALQLLFEPAAAKNATDEQRSLVIYTELHGAVSGLCASLALGCSASRAEDYEPQRSRRVPSAPPLWRR